MTNYEGKVFAADVNAVDESTLIKVEKSMIMRTIIIGSYYKNRKQVRRLDYWINVINRQDAEALEQLQA